MEGPISLRSIEMDSEFQHLKAVTKTYRACTELRTQQTHNHQHGSALLECHHQAVPLSTPFTANTHHATPQDSTHIWVQRWEFLDYENRLASQEGLCPWSR